MIQIVRIQILQNQLKYMEPQSINRPITVLENKGTILLHPKYTKYYLASSQGSKNLNLQKKVIQFYFEPLQSLRFRTQGQKLIFKVHLGDKYMVSAKVVRNGKIYHFERGVYSNQILITIHNQYSSNNTVVLKKQVFTGQQSLIFIQLPNISDAFQISDQVIVEFGHRNPNQVIKAKIRDFRIADQPLLKPLPSKSIYQSEEGPLDTIPENIHNSLDHLPVYSSPQPQGNNLYFCHDMKGGYTEDNNFFEPFPNDKNCYRLLHLQQASIFNYFSHHCITIPPLHWRRLCQRYKCLCLGTFIVEGGHLKSQNYLKEETANMLVYFCKKYRFDGYLINIEDKVHSVGKLSDFLKDICTKLHNQIKNSKVIWYDSVSQKSGQVKYQNELNDHNQLFYQISDGIFLNYWWNQAKITNSIANYVPGKNIYVGNDCFGRGTFAGGQFNLYKGINTILSASNKIAQKAMVSPAVFAMGYTYEGNAETNLQLWKLREKAMYRGVTTKQYPIQRKAWQYIKGNLNGYTWNFQDQWAITSFLQCQRIYKGLLKKMIDFELGETLFIKFMCYTKGTGPNFADSYSIRMQVHQGDFCYHEVSTNYQVASEDQKLVQLTLKIDSQLITQNTFLVVSEEGTDAEKWGGHFGSRFKGQCLYIISYNSQKDWSKSYELPQLQLPYKTNFNLGHGSNFFYRGKSFYRTNKYNYLSDMQSPIIYLHNNPLTVDIVHSDAFTGGTSLRISGTTRIKCGTFSLLELTNEQKLNLRLIFKPEQTPQFHIKAYLSCQKGQKLGFELLKREKLEYGWHEDSFMLDLSHKQVGSRIGKLFLEVENEHISFLLGELSMYVMPALQEFRAVSVKQLDFSLSEINPPIRPFCFDLRMRLSEKSRVLILINQEFACFGHADILNEHTIRLKNMSLNALDSKSATITVMQLNSSLDYSTVAHRQIKLGISSSNDKIN